jgi:dimeric dUTPase (all-alpha-NTP-PPase superfamily)
MLIAEMQARQLRLDDYIGKAKGLKNIYSNKYIEDTKLALYVELGELANATRIFKTWSNKGAEPKERILDEFADCIHFLLRMFNFDDYNPDEEFMSNEITIGVADYIQHRTLVQLFNAAFYAISIEEWNLVYGELVCIAIKLGYLKKEVEAAYLKKHQENYDRQKNGY